MPTDPFFKFFLFIIFYIILLLIFRFFGIGEKKVTKDCLNACPKCASALYRKERKITDKFINYLTFKIFNYKRYKCSLCGWQGLRWEREFKAKP
tara:strand:- start:16285 stop:16566 length:282 start_codon:yes stop_codon:yes gene_type:complete